MTRTAPSPELQAFLEGHRGGIIEEWVQRLHTQAGKRYAARPIEELRRTVSEAYDNNCHVLLHGDHSHIDRFIEKITRLRLEAGFSLSHVQMAFEFFREIVTPMLFHAFAPEEYLQTAVRVNRCMAYTIHRFSDHYQAMHEKMIRERNLQLESEVRRRTAELVESERMATIGQITTSLSHEIRNPLSAIKLNLQVIKKNAKLKGNDERRIDICVQEVKRLERILQDLLDFAKPLNLKRLPCNIPALLHRYTELLDEKLKQKSLHVRFDQEPAMPEVPLDPEKFQQAVMNLLFNAIDASPEGGTVHIAIGMVEQRGRKFAALRIRDEGPGIPAELLGEIQKPFFTTKTRGTGLGLTNAELVARAHDGWLEIDDRQGSGAALTLILPAGEH
jgi:signal transduction histidine kinase